MNRKNRGKSQSQRGRKSFRGGSKGGKLNQKKSKPRSQSSKEESKESSSNESSSSSSKASPTKEPTSQNGMSARLAERDVGITEYISQHEGFSGIIKQRFSDFHVNEIDSDWNVVTLTSTALPTLPAADDTVEKSEEYIKAVLPKATVDQLRLLQSDGGDVVEIEATEMNKEDRKKLHKAILLFCGKNRVTSNTKDKNGKKFITISNIQQNVKPDRRVAWPKEWGGDYLYFVLHKENMDTMETVNILASRLKMKPNMITYAGTKDRRAKTSQLMSMFRVEPKKLANSCRSIRGVTLGNYSFKSKGLKLGDLHGNRFRIALRNVTGSDQQINDAMKSLKEKGFINYYGLQRFGSSLAVPTHEIGRALLQSNWKEAVELILKPREGEANPELVEARQIWWESRDANKAFKALRNKEKLIEGKLLMGLAKHGENDFISALENIPRNTRLMYLHSYQSLLWNKVVSRRLQQFGLKPVEGDLVLQDNSKCDNLDESFPDEDSSENTDSSSEDSYSKRVAVRVLSASEVGKVKIDDIVMPLPGHDVKYPNNVFREWFEELLKNDGLSPSTLKQSVRKYSVAGAYRRIIVRPTNVSWRTTHYSDPQSTLVLSDLEEMEKVELPKEEADGLYKALILDFCLPSCVYATMAMREILKCDTNSYYQASLNDYHSPKRSAVSAKENGTQDGDTSLKLVENGGEAAQEGVSKMTTRRNSSQSIEGSPVRNKGKIVEQGNIASGSKTDRLEESKVACDDSSTSKKSKTSESVSSKFESQPMKTKGKRSSDHLDIHSVKVKEVSTSKKVKTSESSVTKVEEQSSTKTRAKRSSENVDLSLAEGVKDDLKIELEDSPSNKRVKSNKPSKVDEPPSVKTRAKSTIKHMDLSADNEEETKMDVDESSVNKKGKSEEGGITAPVPRTRSKTILKPDDEVKTDTDESSASNPPIRTRSKVSSKSFNELSTVTSDSVREEDTTVKTDKPLVRTRSRTLTKARDSPALESEVTDDEDLTPTRKTRSNSSEPSIKTRSKASSKRDSSAPESEGVTDEEEVKLESASSITGSRRKRGGSSDPSVRTRSRVGSKPRDSPLLESEGVTDEEESKAESSGSSTSIKKTRSSSSIELPVRTRSRIGTKRHDSPISESEGSQEKEPKAEHVSSDIDKPALRTRSKAGTKSRDSPALESDVGVKDKDSDSKPESETKASSTVEESHSPARTTRSKANIKLRESSSAEKNAKKIQQTTEDKPEEHPSIKTRSKVAAKLESLGTSKTSLQHDIAEDHSSKGAGSSNESPEKTLGKRTSAKLQASETSEENIDLDNPEKSEDTEYDSVGKTKDNVSDACMVVEQISMEESSQEKNISAPSESSEIKMDVDHTEKVDNSPSVTEAKENSDNVQNVTSENNGEEEQLVVMGKNVDGVKADVPESDKPLKETLEAVSDESVQISSVVEIEKKGDLESSMEVNSDLPMTEGTDDSLKNDTKNSDSKYSVESTLKEMNDKDSNTSSNLIDDKKNIEGSSDNIAVSSEEKPVNVNVSETVHETSNQTKVSAIEKVIPTSIDDSSTDNVDSKSELLNKKDNDLPEEMSSNVSHISPPIEEVLSKGDAAAAQAIRSDITDVPEEVSKKHDISASVEQLSTSPPSVETVDEPENKSASVGSIIEAESTSTSAEQLSDKAFGALKESSNKSESSETPAIVDSVVSDESVDVVHDSALTKELPCILKDGTSELIVDSLTGEKEDEIKNEFLPSAESAASEKFPPKAVASSVSTGIETNRKVSEETEMEVDDSTVPIESKYIDNTAKTEETVMSVDGVESIEKSVKEVEGTSLQPTEETKMAIDDSIVHAEKTREIGSVTLTKHSCVEVDAINNVSTVEDKENIKVESNSEGIKSTDELDNDDSAAAIDPICNSVCSTVSVEKVVSGVDSLVSVEEVSQDNTDNRVISEEFDHKISEDQTPKCDGVVSSPEHSVSLEVHSSKSHDPNLSSEDMSPKEAGALSEEPDKEVTSKIDEGSGGTDSDNRTLSTEECVPKNKKDVLTEMSVDECSPDNDNAMLHEESESNDGEMLPQGSTSKESDSVEENNSMSKVDPASKEDRMPPEKFSSNVVDKSTTVEESVPQPDKDLTEDSVSKTNVDILTEEATQNSDHEVETEEFSSKVEDCVMSTCSTKEENISKEKEDVVSTEETISKGEVGIVSAEESVSKEEESAASAEDSFVIKAVCTSTVMEEEESGILIEKSGIKESDANKVLLEQSDGKVDDAVPIEISPLKEETICKESANALLIEQAVSKDDSLGPSEDSSFKEDDTAMQTEESSVNVDDSAMSTESIIEDDNLMNTEEVSFSKEDGDGTAKEPSTKMEEPILKEDNCAHPVEESVSKEDDNGHQIEESVPKEDDGEHQTEESVPKDDSGHQIEELFPKEDDGEHQTEESVPKDDSEQQTEEPVPKEGDSEHQAEESVPKEDVSDHPTEEAVPKEDDSEHQAEEPVPKEGDSEHQAEECVPKEDVSDHQTEEPVSKEDDSEHSMQEPVPKENVNEQHPEESISKDDGRDHYMEQSVPKEDDMEHYMDQSVIKEDDSKNHMEQSVSKEDDSEHHMKPSVPKEDDSEHMEQSAPEDDSEHHMEQTVSKEDDSEHHMEEAVPKSNDTEQVEEFVPKEDDSEKVEGSVPKDDDSEQVEGSVPEEDSEQVEECVPKEDDSAQAEESVPKEDGESYTEQSVPKEDDKVKEPVPREGDNSHSVEEAASKEKESALKEDENAQPMEEVTLKEDENAQPMEEATLKEDENAQPMEEVALKEDENAQPMEEVGLKEGDSAHSMEEAASKEKESALNEDEDAQPVKESTLKEDDGAQPEEEAALKEDDDAQPMEEATLNEDAGAQPETEAALKENDGAQPMEEATLKDDDGAQPEAEAALKEDDGVQPMEEATLKEDDNAQPGEEDACTQAVQEAPLKVDENAEPREEAVLDEEDDSARPREEAVLDEEDDSARPREEAVPKKDDCAQPAEEVALRENDSTQPMEEAVLKEDSVQPVEEAVLKEDDCAQPVEEAALEVDDSTHSIEETALKENFSAHPMKVVPKEDDSVHPMEVVKEGDNAHPTKEPALNEVEMAPPAGGTALATGKGDGTLSTEESEDCEYVISEEGVSKEDENMLTEVCAQKMDDSVASTDDNSSKENGNTLSTELEKSVPSENDREMSAKESTLKTCDSASQQLDNTGSITDTDSLVLKEESKASEMSTEEAVLKDVKVLSTQVVEPKDDDSAVLVGESSHREKEIRSTEETSSEVEAMVIEDDASNVHIESFSEANTSKSTIISKSLGDCAEESRDSCSVVHDSGVLTEEPSAEVDECLASNIQSKVAVTVPDEMAKDEAVRDLTDVLKSVENLSKVQNIKSGNLDLQEECKLNEKSEGEDIKENIAVDDISKTSLQLEESTMSLCKDEISLETAKHSEVVHAVFTVAEEKKIKANQLEGNSFPDLCEKSFSQGGGSIEGEGSSIGIEDSKMEVEESEGLRKKVDSISLPAETMDSTENVELINDSKKAAIFPDDVIVKDSLNQESEELISPHSNEVTDLVANKPAENSCSRELVLDNSKHSTEADAKLCGYQTSAVQSEEGGINDNSEVDSGESRNKIAIGDNKENCDGSTVTDKPVVLNEECSVHAEEATGKDPESNDREGGEFIEDGVKLEHEGLSRNKMDECDVIPVEESNSIETAQGASTKEATVSETLRINDGAGLDDSLEYKTDNNSVLATDANIVQNSTELTQKTDESASQNHETEEITTDSENCSSNELIASNRTVEDGGESCIPNAKENTQEVKLSSGQEENVNMKMEIDVASGKESVGENVTEENASVASYADKDDSAVIKTEAVEDGTNNETELRETDNTVHMMVVEDANKSVTETDIDTAKTEGPDQSAPACTEDNKSKTEIKNTSDDEKLELENDEEKLDSVHENEAVETTNEDDSSECVVPDKLTEDDNEKSDGGIKNYIDEPENLNRDRELDQEIVRNSADPLDNASEIASGEENVSELESIKQVNIPKDENFDKSVQNQNIGNIASDNASDQDRAPVLDIDVEQPSENETSVTTEDIVSPMESEDCVPNTFKLEGPQSSMEKTEDGNVSSTNNFPLVGAEGKVDGFLSDSRGIEAISPDLDVEAESGLGSNLTCNDTISEPTVCSSIISKTESSATASNFPGADIRADGAAVEQDIDIHEAKMADSTNLSSQTEGEVDVSEEFINEGDIPSKLKDAETTADGIRNESSVKDPDNNVEKGTEVSDIKSEVESLITESEADTNVEPVISNDKLHKTSIEEIEVNRNDSEVLAVTQSPADCPTKLSGNVEDITQLDAVIGSAIKSENTVLADKIVITPDQDNKLTLDESKTTPLVGSESETKVTLSDDKNITMSKESECHGNVRPLEESVPFIEQRSKVTDSAKSCDESSPPESRVDPIISTDTPVINNTEMGEDIKSSCESETVGGITTLKCTEETTRQAQDQRIAEPESSQDTEFPKKAISTVNTEDEVLQRNTKTEKSGIDSTHETESFSTTCLLKSDVDSTSDILSDDKSLNDNSTLEASVSESSLAENILSVENSEVNTTSESDVHAADSVSDSVKLSSNVATSEDAASLTEDAISKSKDDSSVVIDVKPDSSPESRTVEPLSSSNQNDTADTVHSSVEKDEEKVVKILSRTEVKVPSQSESDSLVEPISSHSLDDLQSKKDINKEPAHGDTVVHTTEVIKTSIEASSTSQTGSPSRSRTSISESDCSSVVNQNDSPKNLESKSVEVKLASRNRKPLDESEDVSSPKRLKVDTPESCGIAAETKQISEGDEASDLLRIENDEDVLGEDGFDLTEKEEEELLKGDEEEDESVKHDLAVKRKAEEERNEGMSSEIGSKKLRLEDGNTGATSPGSSEVVCKRKGATAEEGEEGSNFDSVKRAKLAADDAPE